MLIKSSKFATSVANKEDINKFDLPEIALAGKSNVGKSSLLNLLTNRKSLAKTSSVSGKTRLLNFFSINNDQFHIVDLPGYGYAHGVSDEQKNNWAELIETYLVNSKNLKLVCLLIDIRREVSALDLQMINFLNYHRINFSIVLTKCDKLSKQKQQKQARQISNSLKVGIDDIVITSTIKKVGITNLLEVFAHSINEI